MDDRRGSAATVDVPATGSATRSAADGALPGVVLLSKLGHELRSPLTGIVGLSRIMLVKLADGSHTTPQQTHQLTLHSGPSTGSTFVVQLDPPTDSATATTPS